MNLIISNKESTEDYEELARVLDMVKKGELVLNAISDRKESAQYLEEFITIINNAALSMGEVRNDIDDMIAVAGGLAFTVARGNIQGANGSVARYEGRDRTLTLC